MRRSGLAPSTLSQSILRALQMPEISEYSLTVERTGRGTPRRVFDAWTTPDLMLNWWGPEGVRAVGIETDLSVGGAYRIGNVLPTGATVWIGGAFDEIRAQSLPVYTWAVEPETPRERVTVRFHEVAHGTCVVVTHERIPNEAAREQHTLGWAGCMDGLTRHFVTAP